MLAGFLPLAVLFAPSVHGQGNYESTAAVGQTNPEALLMDPNRFVTVGPSIAPQVTVGGCPNQCSVLQDRKWGWEDGCIGLTQIENATLSDCQMGCCNDWRCEVWQWSERGCFRGTAKLCGVERTDITVAAGQQIQHGNVKILDPEKTRTKCKDMYIHNFAHGSHVQKQSKCRDLCYSDSSCILWQATSAGSCHYGPKMRDDGTRHDVDCDETLGGADSFVTGELIEHYCESAPAQVTQPPPSGPGWGTIAAIVGALLGVAILAAIFFAHHSKKPPKKRAMKVPEPEEEKPLNYTYVPTPPPTQYRIVEQAPMTTYQAPMTMQPMTSSMIVQQPLYPMASSPTILR